MQPPPTEGRVFKAFEKFTNLLTGFIFLTRDLAMVFFSVLFVILGIIEILYLAKTGDFSARRMAIDFVCVIIFIFWIIKTMALASVEEKYFVKSKQKAIISLGCAAVIGATNWDTNFEIEKILPSLIPMVGFIFSALILWFEIPKKILTIKRS